MAKRLKPIGQDLVEWCQRWDLGSHTDKIRLCKEFGIEYDSGKHWRSESADIPKSTADYPMLSYSEEGVEEQEIVSEILAIQPKVHLDFVSFDIETTNLKADFSVLLTACIKPYGQESITFRVDDYTSWWADRANDKDICNDISKELSRHAVIVTHYGSSYRFDLPYLRAKMMKYGLPPLPPMFGIDTFSLAKANMCVSSRRLKALSRFLNLGEKEEVEGGLWLDAAMNGTRSSIDQILEHNKQDCVILERLAAVTFPYARSMRRL